MAYTDIDKPDDYFNTVLYSGDGNNNRTITGVGFNPDMSWVKSRNNAVAHIVADIVRGSNKNIVPNETVAEFNPTTGVGSGGIGQVTTDGFTCVQGTSSLNNTNASGYTYVSWNWLANGAGVSNTDGSITSTVSANTTSGFSIVSYTGTGTGSATIGHGLGFKPKAVLIKSRSLAKNWIYWQDTSGDGSGETRLALNLTNANFANYPVTFNNDTITLPSLSDDAWSASSATYIAYCFAEKKGFSKFSSYIGNGSADGPFIYTGFKPAFVMFKNTSSALFWQIHDSARDPFNEVQKRLAPNSSDAEGSGSIPIDFLSNGIKLRTTATTWNESGSNFIYMAFAENPFVTSTSVPTTAR
jgi:hypothetical protein